MEVCLSWLANIRGYLVSVAIHAGLPAVALRHGFAALENLRENNATHVRYSTCTCTCTSYTCTCKLYCTCTVHVD